MTILIKGMEMPKSCEECDFCDYEQGNCLANKERNTLPHDRKRRDWCPLIEVPTPHGRLIDINSIEAGKFVSGELNQHTRWWNGALDSIIDNAPTVIEAEE